MAKKKTNNAKQKQAAKKPFPLKKVIIGAVMGAAVIAAVVWLVVQAHVENAKHVLRGTTWVSQSAKNASGDEVDIHEVYNVRYSQYQGRLTFDDENHFELWLHPGDASDGTHSGTYEMADDKLTVTFDEGTVTDFTLKRSDNEISIIELKYEDYTVSFVRDTPQKTK